MQFQVKSGAMTYSGEVKGLREVFDAVGKIREVLLPGPCGICNSQNTFPASKKIKSGAEEKVFYEHVCGDCTATRRVMLMDNGHMFVSLKGKDKQPLPNGGWSVYKAKGMTTPSGGSFGNDGYREPPARQIHEPARTSEDEVPFGFFIGLIGAGLALVSFMA